MINNTIPVFFKYLFFLFILYSLIDCKGVRKAQKLGDKISYEDVNVHLGSTSEDSIVLHYTGCSGFMIKYKDQAVLHDPFFSNLSQSEVFFQQNKLDTGRINTFFKSYFPSAKDEFGLIKLLLISHTHYDHMLDAPYVYYNFLNKDSVKMLGSSNMVQIMNYTAPNGTDSNRIFSIENDLTSKDSKGQSYSSDNGKIRVLPIHSQHASHFYCIHLFKGENKKPPQKGCQWKEGVNISYLIDFLDNQDSIKFRMYIAGSSSSAPAGCLPQTVIKEHPIDLAITCVASHAYVKNYPQGLLENLNPKHIILSHWENFFRTGDQLQEQAMVVPLTSLKNFFKKMDKVSYKDQKKPSWTLPNPETKMVIHF